MATAALIHLFEIHAYAIYQEDLQKDVLLEGVEPTTFAWL